MSLTSKPKPIPFPIHLPNCTDREIKADEPETSEPTLHSIPLSPSGAARGLEHLRLLPQREQPG